MHTSPQLQPTQVPSYSPHESQLQSTGAPSYSPHESPSVCAAGKLVLQLLAWNPHLDSHSQKLDPVRTSLTSGSIMDRESLRQGQLQNHGILMKSHQQNRWPNPIWRLQSRWLHTGASVNLGEEMFDDSQSKPANRNGSSQAGSKQATRETDLYLELCFKELWKMSLCCSSLQPMNT